MKVVRKSMSGGFFNRIGRKLFGRRDVLTSANMKNSYQKCYDSILIIHHRVMVVLGKNVSVGSKIRYSIVLPSKAFVMR